MEFQVDTSQLSQDKINSSNKTKIEEEITNKFNNTFSNSEIGNNDSIILKLKYVIIQNNSNNMIVYGKIAKDNQSLFSLELNSCIFAMVKYKPSIKYIFSNTKSSNLPLNINDIIIIPCEFQEELTEEQIISFSVMIPYLFQLYICLVSRHKYIKTDSILINCKHYFESMLLSKCLTLIGYNSYINTDAFISSMTNEKIAQNDYSAVSIIKDKNTYNYILDFNGMMLKNKRKTFALLKQSGSFYAIDYDDYTNIQLIPEDFNILQQKGLGINCITIDQSITFFTNYGKIMNFYIEILSCFKDSNINSFLQLIQPRKVKISDLKEDQIFSDEVSYILYD